MNTQLRSVVLSAAAVLSYAGAVLLAGWKIGGRPSWWYEGKALFFPVELMTLACSLVALAGFIYALLPTDGGSGAMAVARRATVTAFAAAVLLLFFFLVITVSGLTHIYAIAAWRRAMWEH
jgi:formate hydrogenlyase subunit 4